MNSMRAQKGQKTASHWNKYVFICVCVFVINDALKEERAHKRQHNQTF